MKKIAYDEMYKEELTHPWYIKTRERLILTLNSHIKNDSKILDVGCGTGGTLLKLQNSGYRNVFGIDKSSRAVYYCKKRNLKKISIGDINHLPFKDKTFDVVICMDVLYHKDVNVKKSLSELYRVLKKSGFVYIQEPAFNLLKSKHDIAIETNQRFTKKKIITELKKSNFKIMSATYYNTLLLPIIFIKRIKDKLRKGGKISSDVHKLPKIISDLMFSSLSLENFISTKLFNLPI